MTDPPAGPAVVVARVVRSHRRLVITMVPVIGLLSVVFGAILTNVDGMAILGWTIMAGLPAVALTAMVGAITARIIVDGSGVLHKRGHPLLITRRVHLAELRVAEVTSRRPGRGAIRDSPWTDSMVRLEDRRGGHTTIWLDVWSPREDLVAAILRAASPAAATDPVLGPALARLAEVATPG